MASISASSPSLSHPTASAFASAFASFEPLSPARPLIDRSRWVDNFTYFPKSLYGDQIFRGTQMLRRNLGHQHMPKCKRTRCVVARSRESASTSRTGRLDGLGRFEIQLSTLSGICALCGTRSLPRLFSRRLAVAYSHPPSRSKVTYYFT